MKKTLSIFIIASLLCACQSADSLKINGTITDAAGETLYLEHIGVRKTETLDSVRLNTKGTFRFRTQLTEQPDLYRLRLSGKQLVLGIDSACTLTLHTCADSLSYATVSGSATTDTITALRRSLAQNDIEAHKAYARGYILRNPRTIAAYYGLLQQKQNLFIFNPYNKQDRQCYAAVATAWNVYYPHTERGKSIYNLVNGIIQEERTLVQNTQLQQMIAEAENAFLDITLPDETGREQSLSALRGNVFLLDFSAVEMEKSAAYIFELRALYNRYHAQGFSIYQVSADTNPLAWSESAQNLPWTTVRSQYGAYTSYFQQYNVQRIPTTFLFNKRGEIVARDIPFDKLPAAIEQCLREAK